MHLTRAKQIRHFAAVVGDKHTYGARVGEYTMHDLVKKRNPIVLGMSAREHGALIAALKELWKRPSAPPAAAAAAAAAGADREELTDAEVQLLMELPADQEKVIGFDEPSNMVSYADVQVFDLQDIPNNSVTVYFAEWCGFCKQFEAELGQVQARLRAEGISLHAFDAHEKNLANPVKFYPTVRYRDARGNDHDVDRTKLLEEIRRVRGSLSGGSTGRITFVPFRF